MSHLVLTRKEDQRIVIRDREGDAEPIVLTVERIKGRGVRLGFEAPQRYRIVRDELPPLADGEGAA